MDTTDKPQQTHDYLHILGRQPALGIAELEAVYGAERVHVITADAALVTGLTGADTATAEAHFPYLGGSVKIARLIDSVASTNWPQVARHLEKRLTHYVAHVSEGKLKLGLSTYGLEVSAARLAATALDCKKTLRATGRSVRIIPNQQTSLSSAQILHNQLTGPLGCELVLLRNGSETLIAQTVYCQDIDNYAARDHGRPMRDAFVGMLPPKLAQIMLNLAASPTMRHKQPPLRILDPFCGTGVILQEALLMGHDAYGTDLESRMIDYSRGNLDWLRTTFGLNRFNVTLEAGDATTHHWSNIDCVAGETYLGTPLQHLPTLAALNEIVMKCDELHRAFFKNIAKQLSPGTSLCMAVPAWRLNPEASGKARFRHLPVIDELVSLGYNQTDFTHVRGNDLMYFRDDQLVARELLVLTRR